MEIGGTWSARTAQGTGVNAEAKLLLLSHAVETWSVQRVDSLTDARNLRSRSAPEAIGATFEGVLRSWQPSLAEGEETSLRDSAMFSTIAQGWPRVRQHLHERAPAMEPSSPATDAERSA